MPVLDDERAARAETKNDTSRGDLVEGGNGLGGKRRRTAIDGSYAGGELDAAGMAGQLCKPGEAVAPPRLAHPNRVIAEGFGMLDDLHDLLAGQVFAAGKCQADARH